MDVSKFILEKEKVDKGFDRIKHNRDIAETYEKIYEDYGESRFKNKATAVKYCYRFWDTEYYRLQAVKDIKRINLCRDLFCPNCQHNLSLEKKEREELLAGVVFAKMARTTEARNEKKNTRPRSTCLKKILEYTI